MCLIAIVDKEKNKNLIITKKDFDKIWNQNSDGLGLTYWDSNLKKWICIKGIMDKKLGWDFVDYCQNKYKKLIIHWRLTSKGLTNEKLTHPFKFTYIKNKKKNLLGIGYLFHNGTIWELGNDIKSDTQELAELISSLNLNKKQLIKFINSKFFKKLINSSRICIVLENEKKIYKFGNFEKYKGLIVSNLSWIYDYSLNYIKRYSNNWYRNYGDF